MPRGGRRAIEPSRTWTTRRLALALASALVLAACSGDGATDPGSDADVAADADTTGGDDADGDATGPADEPDPATFSDGEPWFTIDESAEVTSGVTGTTSTGTVTLLAGADPVRPDEVTAPIVADATWTIDGVDHPFVVFSIGVDECPVPDSGNEDDIPGFRGVGLDPDGQPLNLNAGAPALGINTTYEADWRSTTTAHDWFSPPWVIADGEMRAEEDAVTVVDTGDKVTGAIVVTCR